MSGQKLYTMHSYVFVNIYLDIQWIINDNILTYTNIAENSEITEKLDFVIFLSNDAL